MRSLNDTHVLAIQGRTTGSFPGGVEQYWDGTMTPAGKHRRTQDVNQALVFRNPQEAYECGARNNMLYWRAIRPGYKRHADGFISHWWFNDEEIK